MHDKSVYFQAQRKYNRRQKSKWERNFSWSRVHEDSSEIVEEVMQIHFAKKSSFDEDSSGVGEEVMEIHCVVFKSS